MRQTILNRRDLTAASLTATAVAFLSSARVPGKTAGHYTLGTFSPADTKAGT
jgi:hypothetical protein